MMRDTDWAIEAPRKPFQEMSPMLIAMLARKVARVAKAGSHIRFAACIACAVCRGLVTRLLLLCKHM